MSAPVTEMQPNDVRAAIDAGDAILIDVREPFEFHAEHIAGAVSRPLGQLDCDALRSDLNGKRLIFYCRTGRRSHEAMQAFADAEHASHMAGGLVAWKQAAFPTERHASAPKLDVMRQVQVTAGSLVVIGVGLGAFVSPWLLILAGFVGCGLVFAGLSGWCGMAKLLGRMPWNRLPA